MAPDFQHTNILAGLRETCEERERIRGDAKRVDDKLVSLVVVAREHGISWQEVGAVLGTSKQAAWERYGWLDKREGGR
jgi:hypothetical protein